MNKNPSKFLQLFPEEKFVKKFCDKNSSKIYITGISNFNVILFDFCQLFRNIRLSSRLFNPPKKKNETNILSRIFGIEFFSKLWQSKWATKQTVPPTTRFSPSNFTSLNILVPTNFFPTDHRSDFLERAKIHTFNFYYMYGSLGQILIFKCLSRSFCFSENCQFLHLVDWNHYL